MLSQHEDGNLQTTPLLCYYAVDFGVTGFRSIFFFSFPTANSQIKTVICAVHEIWILVRLFYLFIYLFSLQGFFIQYVEPHTYTHVQAIVFIYHIMHWLCLSFF